MPDAPSIRGFFDPATNSVTYLLADPASGEAAVVDPVLDFDPASGAIATRSADRLLAEARAAGWRIAMVLETHVHADHLTAADHLRRATGAAVGIGEQIGAVQQHFAPLFLADDVKPGGGDFDRLLADGERFRVGRLEIAVLHLPGHTPESVGYRIGDCLFVGDTLFMPDYGTARTDFPGGDCRQLYRSIRRLLALPRPTRLFMCHDYKGPGRDAFAWESDVGAQRDGNVHVRDGVGEEEFAALRQARDSTLPAPRLLLPAIQVNIRAGRLPPAEANGIRYLRLPLREREDGAQGRTDEAAPAP